MDVLRVTLILIAIFSLRSAGAGNGIRTYDFTELGAQNADTFDVSSDYGANNDVNTFDPMEIGDVDFEKKVDVKSKSLIKSGSIRNYGNTFNVMKYGARGDGKTNNAQAFLEAWNNVCGNGGTLLVPQGNFLLYPTVFKGPCKAASINVQVLGNILSPTTKGAWQKCDDWIRFSGVENLVVDGSGEFDGQGEIWWKNQLSCGKIRPTNLAFQNCKNLKVSGIHSLNSARNHFSIVQCDDAHLSDLTITAPDESPNTDGINISQSTGVVVENSKIGTGDDCIAINSGTKSIEIKNIVCGPGHGISIGSLGRGGEEAQVEGVHVVGCTFVGTTNGARIKTWAGGTGYAKSIVFEQITLKNVKRPIVITQNYVDKGDKANSAEDNEELSYDTQDSDDNNVDESDTRDCDTNNNNVDRLKKKKMGSGSGSGSNKKMGSGSGSKKGSRSGGSAVAISDVKFIGFKGTAQTKDAEAITVDCTSKSKCSDIVMNDIHIRGEAGEAAATCQNAAVQAILTEPKVSCS